MLTAVILTQVTFGRSVKATLHYLVGTVSGTVYAGAVAVLIPHPNDVTLAGILALAVPPLALPGAIVPSFSAATLTGRVGAPVPREPAVSRSVAGGRRMATCRSRASPADKTADLKPLQIAPNTA